MVEITLTDEEAYRLIDEEASRYRAYTKSMDEDSRRPAAVAAARTHWLQLYVPLRRNLGADGWRNLVHERVRAELNEKRRKR